MDMERICPQCGASSRDTPFLASFCRNCFIQRNRIFSLPEISLLQCPKCERIRLKGEWVASDFLHAHIREKIQSKYALTHCRIQFHQPDKKHVEARIDMEFNVDGQAVAEKYSLAMPLEKKMCPDCSLRSGGYHEAVIQIRGPKEKTQKISAQLVRLIEKKTFVTKVVQQKEGVDIQVGKKRPGLEALTQLRLDATYTRKLIGEREGKRLYRTTACVRL
ncbi:hypothetical protein HY572_04495 [Candidatus Micrarchaeota archaeon]|nr:hypothetical protein [Candidatus Micrarchaeota archaeon]